jgi:uncharacterized membrane protein YhaH (DUF805 family)
MNFGQAVASGFAKYVNFYGRACRSEFWHWILFAALCAAMTEIVDAAVFIPHPGISPLNTLCTIILLLPSLAVTTRRLHDIGLSGWWLLLVPTGVGILVLLYCTGLEGASSENKYDLRARTAAKGA